MVIECGNWQARPHGGGCCWQLWRYARRKDGSLGWQAQECYPSTLGGALAALHERAMREGDEVVGVQEAAERCERVYRELMAQTGRKGTKR